MADSTINGLTELGTLKENDLMIAWETGAPTNQTKKITAKNARKFSIMEAVCDSAADATTKEIVIDANAIPERIAVTFTHGNTAGDTTLQGFTPLTLSVSYNGGSADFDICDSLGNYAGKGFGGGVDGGIIIFQLLSTKALITNSDIRQKETDYVIKSDGLKDYTAAHIDRTHTKKYEKILTGATVSGFIDSLDIYIRDNLPDDTFEVYGSWSETGYFYCNGRKISNVINYILQIGNDVYYVFYVVGSSVSKNIISKSSI